MTSMDTQSIDDAPERVFTDDGRVVMHQQKVEANYTLTCLLPVSMEDGLTEQGHHRCRAAAHHTDPEYCRAGERAPAQPCARQPLF